MRLLGKLALVATGLLLWQTPAAPQSLVIGAGPQCLKYTVTFANAAFQAAAATADVTLFSLAAHQKIVGGWTKHSVVFGDGAGPMTACTVSVGDSSSTTAYSAAQAVGETNAVSNTAFLDWAALFKSTTAVARNILARFTLTGSNFGTPQLTITAASNAAAAVLTTATHGFTSNNTVTISGFTGNWTPANGTFAVTVLSGTTFSIPVNSTTFGALAGSPIVNVGTFLTGGSVDIWACKAESQ